MPSRRLLTPDVIEREVASLVALAGGPLLVFGVNSGYYLSMVPSGERVPRARLRRLEVYGAVRKIRTTGAGPTRRLIYCVAESGESVSLEGEDHAPQPGTPT